LPISVRSRLVLAEDDEEVGLLFEVDQLIDRHLALALRRRRHRRHRFEQARTRGRLAINRIGRIPLLGRHRDRPRRGLCSDIGSVGGRCRNACGRHRCPPLRGLPPLGGTRAPQQRDGPAKQHTHREQRIDDRIGVTLRLRFAQLRLHLGEARLRRLRIGVQSGERRFQRDQSLALGRDLGRGGGRRRVLRRGGRSCVLHRGGCNREQRWQGIRQAQVRLREHHIDRCGVELQSRPLGGGRRGCGGSDVRGRRWLARLG
jgi:hypothetical protein